MARYTAASRFAAPLIRLGPSGRSTFPRGGRQGPAGGTRDGSPPHQSRCFAARQLWPTVVSAGFRPPARPKTGTLPRNQLAASATGGASLISPQGGSQAPAGGTRDGASQSSRLCREEIKKVFAAGLPRQKHTKTSKASPRAEQPSEARAMEREYLTEKSFSFFRESVHKLHLPPGSSLRRRCRRSFYPCSRRRRSRKTRARRARRSPL